MTNRKNIVAGAVVGLLVAAAVIAYAVMQAGPDGAEGLRAIVHDGDGNVHALSLSEDQEQVITTSLGTNVVVVEDGSVRVREADCANHDCIHQGKLSGPGKQIICLPHKLWIEVVAEDGDGSAEMDTAKAAGDGSGEDSFDAVAR